MSVRRWSLLCGAAMVGMVALSGVVNGVVDAKALPARGAVCVRGGDTARDGASGRELVCRLTKRGALRWQFQSLTAAAATTTAPSTSPTPTTELGVAAPVVVSASAHTDVRITVTGMRPDTGVYSLQWVPYGQSFNTFQMARATSASMSVPSGWFACGRAYTFRVYVMQAEWLLADGHQSQNVTPHSTPFDVVMPACPTPPSCADGGECIVGDTGPGGGIVFYVASGTFTQLGATGSMCTTTCKYLEAAPTNWLIGTTGDPQRTWATDSDPGAGKGNQEASVTGADGVVIGTGYQNSLDIVAQTGNVAASSAAVLAREYGGGSKTDWFLPSKDELNELCKYAKNQAPGTTATLCAGTGVLRSGFSSADYWSSSEFNATSVQGQAFYPVPGATQYIGSKDISNVAVRPVRAFG